MNNISSLVHENWNSQPQIGKSEAKDLDRAPIPFPIIEHLKFILPPL